MLGESSAQRWLLLPLAGLLSMSAWSAGFIVDGDGDGVPFELDECPYTRPGQPVNLLGCSDLPDADEDGIPDVDDRCPVSPPGARTDPEGCSIDSDGDGVPDGIDQCPNTAISTVPDARGCSAPQRLSGGAPEVIVGRPVAGGRSSDRPTSGLGSPSLADRRADRIIERSAAQSGSARQAEVQRRTGDAATASASPPAGSSHPDAVATTGTPVAPSSQVMSLQSAVDRALWGYEVERAVRR
ncbi:MAG: thrombospondin type 3 repeat-containing protein [Pseudomonadota bacterium]|nr:thrombospondin type 3 repeat-containing protein [Pseudomonadota bacterium]